MSFFSCLRNQYLSWRPLSYGARAAASWPAISTPSCRRTRPSWRTTISSTPGPRLRGRDPGFTWGRDGRAPFPPARLDKVALLGLRPHSIDLIHPGKISLRRDEAPASAGSDKPHGRRDHYEGKHVFWSDHSRIRCSFELIDD